MDEARRVGLTADPCFLEHVYIDYAHAPEEVFDRLEVAGDQVGLKVYSGGRKPPRYLKVGGRGTGVVGAVTGSILPAGIGVSDDEPCVEGAPPKPVVILTDNRNPVAVDLDRVLRLHALSTHETPDL